MREYAAALMALALVLAPAAAAQEEAARTIEIVRKIPAAGDTSGQSVKTSSKSSTSMTLDGEARPARQMSRTRILRKKTEIQAANAEGVTKVKVTFMEISNDVEMPEAPDGAARRGGRGRRRTRDGEEIAGDEDLAGRVFVVDLNGDAPRVTDGEGAEVETPVASAVLRHEVADGKYAGWGLPLHEIIPTGRMKVGHRIDLSPEKASILFNSRRRRGMGKGEYSLTLSGITKVLGVDCAVFDIVIKAATTGEEGSADDEGGGGRRSRRRGGPSRTEMDGKLVVGIGNLWLYKLTLAGSTTSSRSMSRGEHSLEIASDSTMKIDVSSLYVPRKSSSQ